ncbi:unnamed protein product [Oppiella nova]|uniref:Nuclear cap-binding protein subunit 2 n=1 Tax=Oppiella nova TaxID=334625 RepID=A0A7R9MCM3_9ACAR|nr:unnamed protein product [Oppiella nova]CAG2173657.1 unnamed protein product [Oppiella nova]
MSSDKLRPFLWSLLTIISTNPSLYDSRGMVGSVDLLTRLRRSMSARSHRSSPMKCVAKRLLDRVIIGLDRNVKTPCGFCFVEYLSRESAANAMRYVNGTRLDDRIIRTDWDTGFIEGRQYGRGKSGGQVRDEYRTDYDDGRGGFGKIMSFKMGPPVN